MPIKNYTSTVSPKKSMGNIQEILAENGARQISMDYDENGDPVALMFIMMIEQVPVQFKLTVDVEGMLQAMKADKKVKNASCNYEQAERTAWKNKQEWIHLQMAEIATNQARLEQLLLGYAVTPTGETLFEAAKRNQILLTEKNN